MASTKTIIALTIFVGPAALTAAELTLHGKTFTFPDDYTLSEAALPPLVERPIEASFDDKGRLYLTESSGSNEPAAEQLKKKPHRVLRLADSDGDGVFDQRTVFAENLMFPEGCLWHEGSLFVAAPPQIWKLTDADGDGIAEQRDVWFDGKTLTGCANDLHGPYAGPDKKLYWCKGAFAAQTYDLPGQPGWTTTASHVFRATPGPNGPENIEAVFTAGMDNPVGLAWTPEGDLIVNGTFFQHPGGGQRDGLIHAVHGGVWGKDHDVLAGHPRTGALMPPMTQLGPAAPCGMIRYGRDLLVCQFNLRKVSRHTLHPEGASYRTDDRDFLLCDHPDFHPTDVIQDPDGSVLIIDTGGWYKLCCPTSQLAKPNVLGAVYRLRKKSGEVPLLAPAPQRTALPAQDHAASLAALTAADPQIRREAAGLLGKGRVREAVPALLEALNHTGGDRFLFHAYTYALLEIGEPLPTRRGLVHANPLVQAGTLYALEQMKSGGLTAAELLPLLNTADPTLGAAGLFVLGRHGDWAAGALPWVRQQLALPSKDASPLLGKALGLLGAAPAIRDLIGEELATASHPDTEVRLLEVMAGLSPRTLPDSWQSPLARLLEKGTAGSVALVLDILGQLPADGRTAFAPALTQLAGAARTSPGLRLQALATLPTASLDEISFSFILASLEQPATRTAAAAVLSTRQYEPTQLRRLAAQFATAGVLERPLLLKAFSGESDEAAGLALVAALEASAALASTPPDSLRATFEKFPDSVQQALKVALAKHVAPDHAARLDALEKDLPAGNIERGSVVFQTAKAACATCHPIGYKGGQVGPDLSKAGAIRTRRDLLEAIVYPHASFVRSYEPVQLTRQDDSIVYGIVTNQGADSVTLTVGAGTPEVRVPQADIKSLTPGQFSLMPQGLDLILTPQELADVVAFLQSQR